MRGEKREQRTEYRVQRTEYREQRTEKVASKRVQRKSLLLLSRARATWAKPTEKRVQSTENREKIIAYLSFRTDVRNLLFRDILRFIDNAALP